MNTHFFHSMYHQPLSRMSSSLAVTPKEENALIHLCSMFETIDCSIILDIIRKNRCDMDLCIDELLVLPEPNISVPAKDPEVIEVAEPMSRLSFSSQLPVAPSPPPFELVGMQKSVESVRFSALPNSKDTEHFIEKTELILAKKKKIEEKVQRRNQKVDLKKKKQQVKEKKRDFARDRRPYRTTSDSSLPYPQISLPSPDQIAEPSTYDQPPCISDERESHLLKIISDLKAENARVEEEKRSAMKWVINDMKTQLADREAQLSDKDKQLGDKDQRITELEEQIQKLIEAFRQSKGQENKLGKLLINSKDILVEGVVTLSKNVTQATEKGWAKVQKEFLNEESERHMLEKMKDFAQTLKEEINKVFHRDPEKQDVNEVDEGLEEVDFEIEESESESESEEDQE